MFTQSVCSPTYRVVKRCDFDLVNKANIRTRCSVSVCLKVRKSALVSVSTNVFHTLASDVVNVTTAPPYQHFSSTKNVSKSVRSASTVSFIPAPTLTVNLVLSLHGRNVLVSVNTTCHVRNVSPYIPLSVNTSTPLVNYFLIRYVMCSLQSVCLSSLKCQLLLSLSMFLRHRYTQSLLRFCFIRFPLLNQQKLF